MTEGSKTARQMTFAAIVLGLLALFMLAGVVPAPGGHQAAVFKSPVFVALLGLLVVSLFGCSIRVGFRWRRAGFQVLHLGVVVVLVGAFMGFVSGTRTDVVVPLVEGHAIWSYDVAPGASVQPGFGVEASDFQVEFYPPDYDLYRPPVQPGDEHEWVRTARARKDGSFDFGPPVGRLAASELRNGASGEWVPQRVLEGGMTLQATTPAARRFSARLAFVERDGRRTEQMLAVNHPVSYQGWRYYLMSYDSKARRYVVVTARHDPGRPVVIAGLWLVIVGTAWLGFARGRLADAIA